MELPPGITLGVEEKPADVDVEALPEGLESFNEQQWPGHQPWRDLGVFLRRDGVVAGGLFGETYAGWLFIRYLWLDVALRRGGLGRGVVALAEAEAKQRGCHAAYVDTFSFQ